MPNARELSQYLKTSMPELPNDHPDRFHFQDIVRKTEVHNDLVALAEKVNQKLGALPDDTAISEIIPPHIRTNDFKRRNVEDQFTKRTKQEIYLDYPIWSSILREADTTEKGHLARFSRTLRDPFLELEGIISLGDLRSTSVNDLYAITSGNTHVFGSEKFTAVIKHAVRKTSLEAS